MLEEKGVPTVSFITEQFVALTQAITKARGMPDLPVIVFPHGIEHLQEDRIRALAEEAFDKVIGALTVSRERAKAR